MTPSTLSNFSLREPPFGKDLADSELWLPPSKLARVDALCEALSARSSVLLVGEPGVGKTSLQNGSAVASSVASLLLRKPRRPPLRTGGPVTQAPSRVANPLGQKRRGGDDMLHSPSNPLTAMKG